MQKSRSGWFQRSVSFFRENGSYLLLSELARLPVRVLRNQMLAGRLGVRRLQIGPRSYLRGLSCIELGENFSAGDGLWLEALTHYRGERFRPRIVIGSHVQVSHWCHIACTHSVTIGDHVLIGSKVIITDHNHGAFGRDATPPTIPPAQRPLERDRFVRIEANVWLGDGVVVCPGVTMGEGSVAGANAVVTTDVAPFTLVAGVPARPIRRYDPGQRSWVGL
jgi:lipopolysaccharide O-acetyltransferase